MLDCYENARTPEDHVSEIESLCVKLQESPLVESAMINDFGRYSNFDIFVVPTQKDSKTTNSLKKLVRDTIKELQLKCKLRQANPARKTKEVVWSYGIAEPVWDRNYWSFDIDYNSYDASTNSFS